MTTAKAAERALEHAVLLPLIALLLVGSGAAALIYEIIWYQLLQLAVGSTAVSLGVLLATFMGGLCLGSLMLPRLLPRARIHPLLVFAGIELMIGVLGVIELVLIPIIGTAYIIGPQTGLAGMLWRGLFAAICLLPPTVLMGASLPALVRWVELSPRGVSWWGLFYGANTLGAVTGCIVAGFYLLRLYDVTIATFAAAALNLAVALVAAALASRTPAQSAPAPAPARKPSSPEPRPERITVLVAIALSGASALGAEVVWTRLMGLTLGATVYAFSIILAVFLAGLALGTALASLIVRDVNPRSALGWSQLLSAFGIAWTAMVVAEWYPYWPINPQLAVSPVYTFQIDLVRTVWATLPATIAWGASFPFAFAALNAREADPGAVVGGVYAANTFGAILGALGVSLILIPEIGTQDTQRALIAISLLSGVIVLFPILKQARSPALELGAGITVGLAALFALWLKPVPGELIAYGRRIATNAGQSRILYAAEGRNTSIAVSQWNDGAFQFHVAGKIEASTEDFDMRLQRMLGHLPALIHEGPRSVLVVGFGGGVTAGTFTTYPTIQRILICELEPLIPPASTRYFATQNYNVIGDKRTELVYDDARHLVATTRETFDIITSDPIHPFVKGSASLYSREYFELVKAHLNQGGVVSQWVPLYESDAATVKSQIATFFSVFPNGTVWANLLNGGGYDLVLIGRNNDKPIDLDAIDAKLAREDYARVADSLRNVKMNTANDLFVTYAGSADGLKPWLADAQINRDTDLRLQYLAGLALNRSQEDAIYREIRQYWAPPVGVFAGSPARLDALYTAMVSSPPFADPNVNRPPPEPGNSVPQSNSQTRLPQRGESLPPTRSGAEPP